MVAVLLALGAMGVLLAQPGVGTMVHAMRELGLLAGIRCTHEATYVYDPRRESGDRALVIERPQEVVEQREVTAERVEVHLKTGEAIVWARDHAGQRRVYELVPGRARSVTLDQQVEPLCVSALGAWRIVGEHALG